MNKNINNKGRFVKGNTIRVGLKHSIETRKKISDSGKATSFWKGKTFSEEYRKKLSDARKGSKHWNWRGGITNQNAKLRNTYLLKKWKKDVKKRDLNTCVLCKKNSAMARLCVDHIKSFALFPDLRFEVSNGRVLCYPCHEQTSSFGGRTATSASR